VCDPNQIAMNFFIGSNLPNSASFGIAILSRDDSRLTHDNRKVGNSNRFGEHVQEEIEAVS
jgi:hypothetical protein